MAKKKQTDPSVSRKVSRLREREQEQQRILFIALGLVAALIVIILVFGYWRTSIAILDETIATVNNVPLKVRAYQARARYNAQVVLARAGQIQEQLQQFDTEDPAFAQIVQYYQQQFAQEQAELIRVPAQALEDLIDDELVRQEAQRRGISVSPAEVDREIELALNESLGYTRPTRTPTEGPSPTPTHTPTITLTPTGTATPLISPTATATLTQTLTVTPTQGPTGTPLPTQTPLGPEAYATEVGKLKENISKSRYSYDDYRGIVEINLLRNRLNDALATDVVATQEQIHARHILVKTFEEAQAIEKRLQAGEDFAALAAALSTETGAQQSKGDLGWAPRGQYVPEFEEAVWALTTPLQISEPITSEFGIHIIQLLEKDANRPLDADALANKQATALSDLLEQLRVATGTTISRFFSTDYVPSEIRRLQTPSAQ